MVDQVPPVRGRYSHQQPLVPGGDPQALSVTSSGQRSVSASAWSEGRSEYIIRQFITCFFLFCVGVGLFLVNEALIEQHQEELCAELATRAQNDTEYRNGVCWVNINTGIREADDNWVPAEWLN